MNSFGVAGCGSMGLPMAQALLKAGFDVSGFDVRPANEFSDFSSHMISDAHTFSNKCDMIICVVRDEQQVLDLCFDDQAIFNAQNPPQTFVLSSTVSPHFVHKLRKKLPPEVVLVDAPMSGAPLAAIAATLTFMVGGPEQAITALQPAFAAMGSKIHHLGDLGAGMGTKVLNNFIAASTVVTIRNVLAQAEKLDIDEQRLLTVMSESSGQTWFGTNFNNINWAAEGYDRTNTIGILEKDVTAFIDSLPDGPEPLHEAVIAALQSLPPKDS